MGQKSLDRAVEEFGPGNVEVNWLPYMIDAATNPEGEEYLAYNQRRWGSDGWTRSLRQRGAAIGANFKDWRWWPHTLNAHCLVHFAESKGISSSTVKAALFKALYEEGQNVSGPAALADLAKEKLGLDREEVLEYLDSRAGVEGVLQAVQVGQKMVQGGVPFFVVSKASGTERPVAFSGAVEPNQFVEVFNQVASD